MATSSQNYMHLHTLCSQFLADKFQIRLTDQQLKGILKSSVQELMQFFQSNPPLPSLEEFNKRAIVRVKEKAMLLVRETSVPVPPPLPQPPVQSAPPPLPSPAAARQDSELLPPPVMERGDGRNDATIDAEEASEDFAKRLQQLELQRSANIAPKEGIGSTTPPPPVLSSPPVVPPPPTNAPTVLYVPTVQNAIRYSKTILIHSAERLWDYFHDRNTFVWAGPLPPEHATITVASVQLPVAVSHMTPVVLLHIQGAGGQTMDIHCVRMQGSGENGTWDTWQPCGGAVLRAIACPWNIQIKDALQNPLDLGQDGMVIEEALLLPRGTTTRLKLSHSSGVTKGCTLICRRASDGALHRTRVLQVSDVGIEVKNNWTAMVGYVCCVWSMQTALVLETTKNETDMGSKK